MSRKKPIKSTLLDFRTDQRANSGKNNYEDLMNLVQFLEIEKQELLKYIENQLTAPM